jgi:putative transposase
MLMFLKLNQIEISMTQSGSPYENALAERMNGILKNEFYPKRVYQNHKEAVKILTSNIEVYNSQRPHLSLGYLTPQSAHQMTGNINKSWKSYPKKKRF